jgi:hypothetical protein
LTTFPLCASDGFRVLERNGNFDRPLFQNLVYNFLGKISPECLSISVLGEHLRTEANVIALAINASTCERDKSDWMVHRLYERDCTRRERVELFL